MEPIQFRRSFQAALVALGLAGLCVSAPTQAADSIVRTVSGEVEAVNMAVAPPIIVVKVRLPSKEEMIVGATVAADVPVARGKKRTSLAEIRMGEQVSLTYEKHAEGLAARSIHAR
jgi:hypothetical protein